MAQKKPAAVAGAPFLQEEALPFLAPSLLEEEALPLPAQQQAAYEQAAVAAGLAKAAWVHLQVEDAGGAAVVPRPGE